MDLVNSDRVLTYDEKVFIMDNYHESQGQLNNLAGAFFTPSGLASDFGLEVPENCTVVDMCAGIGALSFHLVHRLETKREIVCVERCVEYFNVGKRILPEVEWVNADIFDWAKKCDKVFDVSISNPPFGKIKEDTYQGDYKGGEFEFKVIETAKRISNYGVFIIPQTSAPFRYSGARYFEMVENDKHRKFVKDTNIILEPSCGIDTSIYANDWKGVSPICEVAVSDFAELKNT